MKNSLIVKSVLVATLAVSHAPAQAVENPVLGSLATCFMTNIFKNGMVENGHWSGELASKFRYVIKDCDATAERIASGEIEGDNPIFKGEKPSHESCNTNKKFLRGLEEIGFSTDSLMSSKVGDEKRMCDAFFDEEFAK